MFARVAALAFGAAAALLGLGYVGLAAVAEVDDTQATSMATELGDSTIAPAVKDAVEDSALAIGVAGAIVCALVLAAACLALLAGGPAPEFSTGG